MRTRLLGVATLATVLLIPATARAAAGDLDTTFGTGGRTITTVGQTRNFSNSTVNAAASDSIRQPDGKLLTVGFASRTTSQDSPSSLALVRLTANGALDPTFNDDGVANFPIETDSSAAGVTLAGGKIYVAGVTVSSSNSDVLIARVTDDGMLDTTFGGGTGFVKRSLSASDPAERAVSIDTAPDGSLVVLAAVDAKVGVLRLNADGSGLAGFGVNGFVAVNAGGQSMPAAGAKVLADGRVLLGGRAVVVSSPPARFFSMRLSATGEPDATYGTGGYTLLPATTTNASLSPYGFLVDEAGRALVSGLTFEGSAPGMPAHGIVARALADGGPDTGFGANGAVTLPAGVSLVREVAETPGGKLVFGAYGFKDGTRAMVAGRLTSTGALDPSWSGDGLSFYTTPSTAEAGGGVLPQPDGSVVVAGAASDAGDLGILVTRFLGDPAPVVPTAQPNPTPTPTPVVTPPAVLTPVVTSPLGAVRVISGRTRSFASGRFALSLECSRACSLKVTIRAGRADARKLKLAKKVVTLATATGRRTSSGKVTLKPRAKKRFRARLLKLKKVPVTATIRTTDTAGGKVFTTTKKISLTRRRGAR